jgi:hypothetical protein
LRIGQGILWPSQTRLWGQKARLWAEEYRLWVSFRRLIAPAKIVDLTLHGMTDTKLFLPDSATGHKLAGEITDKRGYGERWNFSKRHIDNFLADGMPHLKIGKRRVRIIVAEADEWMRKKYGVQRRSQPAKRSTAQSSRQQEELQP